MSNTYTFFGGISPDLRNNLLVNLFQATALVSENEILTSDVQEALVKLDIGRPEDYETAIEDFEKMKGQFL